MSKNRIIVVTVLMLHVIGLVALLCAFIPNTIARILAIFISIIYWVLSTILFLFGISFYKNIRELLNELPARKKEKYMNKYNLQDDNYERI